ncbi:MAG TPA: NADH-quinone oxidoreductase subunit N [Actinomycetota bacterium]|nr:NADH-quinone oxidoreductase subunit N [Actinomycetota bacterium]
MPFDPPAVELAGIAPEIALTITALFLMVFDAFVVRIAPSHSRWYSPVIATLGLTVATLLAVSSWGANEVQLGGAIALDGFAIFVKIGLAVFATLTVWLARDYLAREGLEDAEFYVLILFATAGMMLMAAAADLIVVFLALETFSLAIYVLVGFRRRSTESQESALKYFLLGAFSSAFFLLGVALAYGAAGTTAFYSGGGPSESISRYLGSTPTADLALMVVATGFLIVGMGFKVAAVPFHAWTPDAYQGAPAPVTGFMAAATKIAAFAATLRLLDAVLFPLRWDWQPLILVLATVTMVVGSVVAIVQEDLKRLLAYSSIAHAGFILTGVVAANDDGISGSLFYLVTYGVTVLGAFAVLSVLSGKDEQRIRMIDFKGLFYESPLLAGAFTLFLLSLAGVPITSGFVGKLVVFGAAVEAGYAWLAVVGVLASAIAAFFYLRVLVVMYMQEPDEPRDPVRPGVLAAGVVSVAAASTVLFGLLWGPLVEAAQQATFIAGR